jgi:hypothetical protein
MFSQGSRRIRKNFTAKQHAANVTYTVRDMSYVPIVRQYFSWRLKKGYTPEKANLHEIDYSDLTNRNEYADYYRTREYCYNCAPALMKYLEFLPSNYAADYYHKYSKLLSINPKK